MDLSHLKHKMTLFWVEAGNLTNLTCGVPRESRVVADVRHDEVDRGNIKIIDEDLEYVH